MTEKIFELETGLVAEGNQSDFILTEEEIKQEPEFIIKDEIETENVREYFDKDDISEDDRMNLVWHDCEICEESFLNIEDLSLHHKSHRNSKEFSTNISIEDESRPKSIYGKKEFQCHRCDCSYDQETRLREHYRRHFGKRYINWIYSCVHCDEEFTRRNIYEKHLTTHTAEKSYKCEFCDRSYCGKRNLLKHIQTHADDREAFECETCQHPFRSKRDLLLHSRIHDGEYLYKDDVAEDDPMNLVWHNCEICEERFLNIEDLSLHHQSHQDSKESATNISIENESPPKNIYVKKEFQCDRCNCSYDQETRLKEHYRLHRGKLYPKTIHKCAQCDVAFTYRIDYEMHMKSHPGIKPFKCDICDRSFYVNHNLVVHYRKHTGERPYKCHICDKAFAGSSSLKNHVEAHGARKPFKCSRCTCSFDSKIGLSRHYQLHIKTSTNISIGIKQEPELIIEDEVESEKIRKYLHKDDITTEDRMNLVWRDCEICEERFLNIEDLSLHHQSHQDSKESATNISIENESPPKNIYVKKEFQCDRCNCSYDQETRLKEHYRLHRGKLYPKTIHKCAQCDVAFTYRIDYEMHMKSHPGIKPFKCDICDRSFYVNHNLVVHYRKHTGERPYKCHICDKAFAGSSSLKNHVEAHGARKPFKCSRCTCSFDSKIGLSRHYQLHIKTSTNISIGIKQEPELIIEDEVESEKIRKYLHKDDITTEDRMNLVWRDCEICEERFLNIEDLSLHHQSHQDSKESATNISIENESPPKNIYVKKEFQCDRCNCSYDQETRLKEHYRLHRGKTKTIYKCAQCDVAFTYRIDYEMHMVTHTGEKPYKCDLCDRSYYAKSNLLKHLKMHTDRETLQCERCQRPFRTRLALLLHSRIHNSDRVFRCYCDKAFLRNDSLQKHIWIHTGEIPFQCPYCAKTFCQENLLQIHINRHINGESFKTDH